MSEIVLRCNFNDRIGGGHLSRCLALAADAPKPPLLLLGSGADSPPEFLKETGVAVELMSDGCDFDEELKLWRQSAALRRVRHIVFDFSNPDSYKNIRAFARLVVGLREDGKTVTVIDGLGMDSLISLEPDLAPNYLVTPYVGATALSGVFQHLCGPDYFILNSAFRPFLNRIREIPGHARKILVTCGQSDPTCVSTFVLKTILKQPNIVSAHIRVIIGAAFSSALRDEVQALALKSSGLVEMILSPANIAEFAWWADLAIATTGLTKYELAASGTPAIFISHNQLTADVHQSFELLRTGIHLGVREHVDEHLLGAVFCRLVTDSTERMEMAERGRHIVDGRGAGRIFERILGGLK